MKCLSKDMTIQGLVDKLYNSGNLDDDELCKLIADDEKNDLCKLHVEKSVELCKLEQTSLFKMADSKRREIYGEDVYIRGLIEMTNYCKNDCFYCGIRRSNSCVKRYRMTDDEIMSTCQRGYELGFRTFVLQGGEDSFYTDSKMCEIVSKIRNRYPDCAITLSIGEKSRESYKAYFEAGANRYLLRHETASDSHYRKLHPDYMSLDNRKRCLYDLKEIGYQVGSGFMVGSPYQTTDDLIKDIRFLQDLDPDMIGIGPFIPAANTPFEKFANDGLELTLRMIAILRLIFPYALIPATTALGSIHPEGREMGLMSGANVIMPNLTPTQNRKNYKLYDNKICMDDDPEICIGCIENRVSKAGYKIVNNIGNPKRKEFK
ncbi:MAG: [FeFe] hydrogenase H-cluster radical SAM maturase HydE [Lachnospiraceae bacterium]|nr:[FeFe] hydrogenase H-cluster radical SAM maturase HydE [Lachnospiraceae bacterium]